MSVPSSKITYTYDTPKSVNPRTVLTFGAEISALTIGYVTWSSIRSGLRPIQSVDTITWTSEMSGTASSGVAVAAHTPHAVSTSVPVKTRNRLRAHHSISRPNICCVLPCVSGRSTRTVVCRLTGHVVEPT